MGNKIHSNIGIRKYPSHMANSRMFSSLSLSSLSLSLLVRTLWLLPAKHAAFKVDASLFHIRTICFCSSPLERAFSADKCGIVGAAGL